MLDVAQTHINFGNLEKGDSKSKTIIIHVRFSLPLTACRPASEDSSLTRAYLSVLLVEPERDPWSVPHPVERQDQLERLQARRGPIRSSKSPLAICLGSLGLLLSLTPFWTSMHCLQVGPFGKKEVAGFVFTPSMPGLFSESLIVENVQDGDNDMVVSVKATVRKTYS